MLSQTLASLKSIIDSLNSSYSNRIFIVTIIRNFEVPFLVFRSLTLFNLQGTISAVPFGPVIFILSLPHPIVKNFFRFFRSFFFVLFNSLLL